MRAYIDSEDPYYSIDHRVGDKVNLTILRDNTIKEVNVTLGEMPIQPPENANSNYSQELYDECVTTAGKSFCDFLFKR